MFVFRQEHGEPEDPIPHRRGSRILLRSSLYASSSRKLLSLLMNQSSVVSEESIKGAGRLLKSNPFLCDCIVSSETRYADTVSPYDSFFVLGKDPC